MSKLQHTYTWVTREGVRLEIHSMATPHLLATIHMIERNRMNNLLSIAAFESWTPEVVEFYGQFPEAYEALCAEAERRHVIRRGIPVHTNRTASGRSR